MDLVWIANKKYCKTSEIKYFVSQENYTRIYLEDGSDFLMAVTLKRYVERIVDSNFVLIYHGVFINKMHLKCFKLNRLDAEVIMKDGKRFAISRRKIPKVRKVLKDFKNNLKR